VWRRLDGDIVPGIIQFKVLNAGEGIELSHHWDQRTNRGQFVGPGRYAAQGSVLTNGPEPLASVPTPFVIVPD
jgi:hypothetical protein